MKKVLSCLCAVVLLLSTLLVGAVPASATDVENPLLADYRTEELFNAAVAAGKLSTGHADRAEVSFNATLGAANITYKNPSGATRADETWIYMDPVNEVAVAGNEVIVAKVKAPAGKNADGFLTYSHRAMAGDKGITYKNTADNNGNHWYTKAGASEVLAGEDGWLYVSYTAKADVDAAGVAADAKWGRVQVIGHGFFYNTNDTLSIAWVGAFESLEAAKAWDEGDSDSTTTATTVTTTVTMAAETTTTSTVAETTTSTVTETTVVSTETTTTTATETTTTTAETTTTTVEETTTTKPALEVSKGDKFYFDFSTEEGYKAMSGWGNYRGQLNNAKGENSFNLDSTRWREASNLAYDAEVGGAKIVKKDDATSPIECVLFKRAEGLDAEYPDEYPVVGIKVKINKKATPGIFGYSAAISSQWQWPWSWSISGYTGEWQLITFTVDDYKSTIDDQSWKGLIGQLVKNPQDFANDEVIGHIAWGGVFASEDDAMNHFINTTPDYVAPEPPVDDGTPFLVDLTTKEKYDSAVENGLIFTNNTDNASLEYNENVGAAMFTYLNGRPISDARRGEAGFCFRAGKDLKVADGKVIVAKLRFSSANYLTYSHKAMIKNGATIQYTNGTNGNFEYAASNPSMLKGDGEWVYCAYTDPDVVDSLNFSEKAAWSGVDIIGHGCFYQEGDTLTVAWVGAFESLEAAKAWDMCRGNHAYSSDCDAECNVCALVRETTAAHTYDKGCDIDCNVCGDLREIEHKYAWVVDMEATCGARGKKHEECTVCGAVRSENTVIPATGNHAFVWVTDYENNCGVDGEKHEECSVCGAVRSENTAIPATGKHSYEWVTDIEATCVQPGMVHAECSVCQKTYGEPVSVEAKGHSWNWVIDQENNCGVNGSKHEECTLCHVKRSENAFIPATGDHTYDGADDLDCNVCGYVRKLPRNGWILENGKWYYYKNDTMLKNTWQLDSVGWCYLGSDGAMRTNAWIKDSVGWCYVGDSGYIVKSNWVLDGGKWYYLNKDGYMLSNTWQLDSVGWCYLGSDGAMKTNAWIKDSVGWCYVGAGGYCVTNNWVKDSVGWVYLDHNGRMLTNSWVQDSVGWCYVGADGYAVTECWKKDSVGWCYLDKNGSMTKNEWVKDGGKWYYLDGNGYMVTGTKTIDGKTHTFYANGVWAG